MILGSDLMNIGELNINNLVILAPMAGLTDYPYRKIIRSMGCELLYTEMVSSKGLLYGNRKTKELLNFSLKKGERIGIQLFGEEPESMAKAAKMLVDRYRPDLLDINMGCPTHKVVKSGSGSALMKNPKLAAKIIYAVSDAVNIPVTIKMRKGWDNKNINAVELSKLAEHNGAQAVTIHGRSREEYYTGKADWDIIKKVKENVNIPVIGNGDIYTIELAKKMLEKTKCDAIMIGRGALGNPWLIKRASYYINRGEILSEPGYEDRIEMAIYHLNETIEYYGVKNGISKMRKHLGWYIKGMPGSSQIKNKIFQVNDPGELIFILEEYLKKLLYEFS
jgi:tRNA-dihydrouridine synthase B